MWRRLFKDCNKKQDEEIERLMQDYKERTERLALTTAVETTIPTSDVPRGQSPMELLAPRELSETMEVRIPTAAGRVTIRDPSDTLGDPVMEKTVQKLIETAGQLVAKRSVTGSRVTAPYGTIEDKSRVELSSEVMKETGAADVTKPTETSKVPDTKIRGMPMKKVSRAFDIQNNSQIKSNFTGVSDKDMRACFYRSTWSQAMNMQQPQLGTSHLILGDSLVRVLQNLRISWITAVMAFGGATVAQFYRMVELINPGRIPDIITLIGTNNFSRSSDEEEAHWESMMVCFFTTL